MCKIFLNYEYFWSHIVFVQSKQLVFLRCTSNSNYTVQNAIFRLWISEHCNRLYLLKYQSGNKKIFEWSVFICLIKIYGFWLGTSKSMRTNVLFQRSKLVKYDFVLPLQCNDYTTISQCNTQFWFFSYRQQMKVQYEPITTPKSFFKFGSIWFSSFKWHIIL